MSDDQFTKLFKYIQNEFKAVRGEIGDLKDGQSNILGSMDAYAKKVDDYHQELLMLSTKVERLDRWIHEIAEKTGVKLTYN